jgi:hypothetical protein
MGKCVFNWINISCLSGHAFWVISSFKNEKVLLFAMLKKIKKPQAIQVFKFARMARNFRELVQKCTWKSFRELD